MEELLEEGLKPALLVSVPDKPRGRKMKMTPSPAKVWAKDHDIQTLTPERFDSNFIEKLKNLDADLFATASYGKIIPKKVLEVPEHGALNVHPSLLPHLRGPSPIESAILADAQITGVTIMLMDEKMDHGPILAQEIYEPEEWPPKASELEKKLARLGGRLLSKVIPDWLAGDIDPQIQDHKEATYTKKISKEDAEIDPGGDPYENLLKIRAYEGWPRAYFFIKTSGGDEKRIIITEAHIEDDKLVLDKVIPEGKKEMRWKDFERNLDNV